MTAQQTTADQTRMPRRRLVRVRAAACRREPEECSQPWLRVCHKNERKNHKN